MKMPPSTAMRLTENTCVCDSSCSVTCRQNNLQDVFPCGGIGWIQVGSSAQIVNCESIWWAAQRQGVASLQQPPKLSGHRGHSGCYELVSLLYKIRHGDIASSPCQNSVQNNLDGCICFSQITASTKTLTVLDLPSNCQAGRSALSC